MTEQTAAPPPFLAGGGEAARMIAARDWSSHPLGAPETWPDGLRAALSLVLNSPESMILAWGPELTFFFNDTYFPLLGPRLPWAMGARFQDVWPDAWDQASPIIADAFAGRSTRFVDLPWTLGEDRGARQTWWTFSYSRVLDGEGAVAGLFIFTNETTARVLGDAALRESQQQLEQALHEVRELNATLEQRVRARTAERNQIWRVSRDMLLVADGEGSLLSVNPAWTRILGWDESELVGRTTRWLEHPADLTKTEAEVAKLMTGENSLVFENRFRTRAGDYRDMSWTATVEDGLIYAAARDVTEDKARERELLLNRNIVMSDVAPICAFDHDFRLIAFNAAHEREFFRIYGHRVQVGEVFPDLFLPEQAPIIRGFMARALAGETFTIIEEFGDPGLIKPYWEVSYTPLRDPLGEIVGAFHHARDVSARLRAEAELRLAQDALRQSQKMEAVGQLTGGLAHDFNNLLAGISGSLELMQTRISQGRLKDIERYMTAAQGAARRAAALTHRLLAFSRRQTLAPKPTDVNRLVAGMEDLVRRTVGPAVTIEVVGASGAWPALVDPPQLENALLNLCINARDAMPDGGRVTIETANKWLDERAGRERDLPPGQYLSLCVTDTGCGMTPDVAAKAFDPFFTTKPIGEGTGLGLSMIYGFAKQSGGQVRLYSEVGQGTTVCIYLPRHHLGATADDGALDAILEAPRAQQGETVLVVDDEPTVRMLVTDVLEDLGYTSLEAPDSAAGLKILQSDVRIDLLVSDVGLPGGMNGRQMADAGRAVRPGLKVLFITGYAENAVLSNGQLEPGMQVLTKPFVVEALAERIRDLIAGR